MRTRTRVCLLALCAALLTGCGGPTEGAKAYDPAAAAQALLDAKVFDQELEVLDADLAGSYLGLSSEPEEAVVYTSLEGGYEELAVLSFADEAAAQTALEEVQAHVFDKYYQGKNGQDGKGLGLGLSIVHRIVELCGGSVTVSSEEDQGSTFTVLLPVEARTSYSHRPSV